MIGAWHQASAAGSMTDHQVTLLAAALSSGGPILAVLVGILVNNRQIDSLRREMDARFASMDERFNSMQRQMDERFAAVDLRFTELERRMDLRFAMLENVLTEKLLRVEQILDARLSHLERKDR